MIPIASNPAGQASNPRAMKERVSLRPARSGHPRRKAKGYTSTHGAERSAGPGRQPRSLDNSNQVINLEKDIELAISCQEWLEASQSKEDKYNDKCFEQSRLLNTLALIIKDCERTKERIEAILFNPACEDFLKRHPKTDAKLQKLLQRTLTRLESRNKDHARLHNCQREWIGFKATCCNTALAVPIGCNHRLCFLCNSHRSEKYRDRVRRLFDRLEHPQFLTLTVPNIPLGKLRKRVYSDFRKKFNKFRKIHAGWIKGGIIAFETTFNNQPASTAFKTWHVHAHVLIDGAATLPVCKCRPNKRAAQGLPRHLDGCEFIRFKRRLEFDWLLLTGGRKAGWRDADFDYWLRCTQSGGGAPVARYEWNSTNRRVIDIRRVTDRKKAAFEVLKYVTKASYFIHVPEAVEEFIVAVRGTRMLQTFGSWYGFKFEDDVNDWGHLECDCGKHEFERLPGKLFRVGVFMDESGRWRIRRQVLDRGSPPQKVA
jgi:uncharacterized protein YecT (DUF1311 family)